MAWTLLDSGLLRITVSYIKALKPGAPLSYYRRIPRHAQAQYANKTFIRQSLKTRDIRVALARATKLTEEFNALWSSLKADDPWAPKITTPQNRALARAV